MRPRSSRQDPGSDQVGAPHGYTLLINTLPFDTERDFAPVSLLGSSPFVLVVHPSVLAAHVKAELALWAEVVKSAGLRID